MAMYTSFLRVAFLLMALVSAKGMVEGPQAPLEKPIKVTVCELKNDPARVQPQTC